MISSAVRFFVPIIAIASALHATPDISNLNNCINEVRLANASPPIVPTFDKYTRNYRLLLADLEAASATLPYVYKEAAAKPLLQYLRALGEWQYIRIFNSPPANGNIAALKQIIPDAALAILFHNTVYAQNVNAFQEVVADLYDSFVSEEARVSRETGQPIQPPTYGIIPPLVKYGNAESGPYTWPGDATMQLLGMRCAIVSLPPAQIKGGILAWTSLGHETGGHDMLHADAGLIAELQQKIYSTLLAKYGSQGLATYWSNCLDETGSDVLGNLNMGPNAGIGLVGYFRSLGDGKLRTIGFRQGPHPIDLLRGYLAAAVVKRLNFADAAAWSQIIYNETAKDNNVLYLFENGLYYQFPVSLDIAIASCDDVAEIVMRTKLAAIQFHALEEIQKWTNEDQAIVDSIAAALTMNSEMPFNLRGPGFYAAHVVSGVTQAALQAGANLPAIFNGLVNFLGLMHRENPTWSGRATPSALAMLERISSDEVRTAETLEPHIVIAKVPEGEIFVVEDEDNDEDLASLEKLLKEEGEKDFEDNLLKDEDLLISKL